MYQIGNSNRQPIGNTIGNTKGINNKHRYIQIYNNQISDFSNNIILVQGVWEVYGTLLDLPGWILRHPKTNHIFFKIGSQDPSGPSWMDPGTSNKKTFVCQILASTSVALTTRPHSSSFADQSSISSSFNKEQALYIYIRHRASGTQSVYDSMENLQNSEEGNRRFFSFKGNRSQAPFPRVTLFQFFFGSFLHLHLYAHLLQHTPKMDILKTSKISKIAK